MRRSSNDNNTPVNVLQAATSELVFIPTPSQRQVKARLITKLVDNPLLDAASLTLSEAEQITNSAQLKDWWGRPGFKEWFLDQNEYRQRLEYLFSLALDAAEEILLSTDPRSQSARVSMVKLLAELANKVPRETIKYADDAISKMDKAQIEAFLEKNGVSLIPGK